MKNEVSFTLEGNYIELVFKEKVKSLRLLKIESPDVTDLHVVNLETSEIKYTFTKEKESVRIPKDSINDVIIVVLEINKVPQLLTFKVRDKPENISESTPESFEALGLGLARLFKDTGEIQKSVEVIKTIKNENISCEIKRK